MAKSLTPITGSLDQGILAPASTGIAFSSVVNGQLQTQNLRMATYQLSDQIDKVTGTAQAEAIIAFDGNDTVMAGGGNDYVSGGAGNDQLWGGDGNDHLDGGIGNDKLMGEAGDDVLFGGVGDDFLYGGAGNDHMAGGQGNDWYYVDDQGDRTVEAAGEGADTVMTNLATYTLQANVENLNFYVNLNSNGQLVGPAAFNGTGNSSDNTMTGWSLNDTLYGMDGNDTLNGEGGQDTLWGGGGNDLLDGGQGADELRGGMGNDIYRVDNAQDLVIEMSGFGSGIDTVVSTLASTTLGTQVENLVLAGPAAPAGQFNTGIGNTLDNTLTGGVGNDKLQGLAGNDTLIGGSGKDWLDGGAGVDVMKGGLGDDQYTVDSSADQIVEAAGAAAGEDWVVSTNYQYTLPDNVENLSFVTPSGVGAQGTGNASGNLIEGTYWNDTLVGLGGSDNLRGRHGADDLYGGAGNDHLYGDEGDDRLFAGTGWDELTGGAGKDRFIFDAMGANEQKIVFDFVHGEDKIDLSALDAQPGVAGNQALLFMAGSSFAGGGKGSVVVQATNAGEMVKVDANGDGLMDLWISLQGLTQAPTASDFVL